jgi:exo-1,4-beta-D-glucosaminidase
MRHEAAMLQNHPSMLTFLVGSDYWPDDRATAIYVAALDDLDWPNPIVCSAAKRGFPELLGPSGLKMDGPYDWVPPNYWYGDQLGAAYGFGSELGSGVGTPEIGSLKKFLSDSDLEDLWTKPRKGLYHMSTNESSFFDRHIYDKGMFNRYGEPTSLDDYLLKAQIMDYEATRSEFEAYQAKWNAKHPATGLIYWMLNNAWPSLHWNQFDYYLHPGGSYFGTKVGSRVEHVAYDYDAGTVYLINHSLDKAGARTIQVDLIDLDGNLLASRNVNAQTEPNTSKEVTAVPGLGKIKDVAFLRLRLSDSDGNVLSRNVYWLATSNDKLNWDKSTWFYTPVSKWADFTALNSMKKASVSVTLSGSGSGGLKVALENKASVPAFFIRLNLVDGSGNDVTPVIWSDNYVTLWPKEKLVLGVSHSGGAENVAVQISGGNVGPLRTVKST